MFHQAGPLRWRQQEGGKRHLTRRDGVANFFSRLLAELRLCPTLGDFQISVFNLITSIPTQQKVLRKGRASLPR